MGRKSNPSDKPHERAQRTAQRFEGKPLKQPCYLMSHVPYCNKNFEGSYIYEVVDREVFTDAIAEMLLLCKEAVRRKMNNLIHGTTRTNKICTKPLSLEYIADRIDVDDPLFGFFVRTAPSKISRKESNLTEGMLQGFITITTFTTWQDTFRWDSRHESAFLMDEPELASQMANGIRKYDKDGSLAAELEATVRCGDPWNEGIVWPHIAEISLLGGLGCGKALLSLAIDRLERMPPSTSRNYDFIVIHATHNAFEFYESMGFVRVGAITHAVKEEKNDGTESQSTELGEIVSSPVATYFTKKNHETLLDISKAFDVNVWDLIFLNHFMYPSLEPKSFLVKKTKLFIPKKDTGGNSVDGDVQWYIAKEDETPKLIALKLKISCQELLEANRSRLPDLCSSSRLMKGTKMQVSHFHIHHERYVPFCHWTFPNESHENSVPSYMMVRRLNRSVRTQTQMGPVESDLSVPVIKFSVNNKTDKHADKRVPSVKASVKNSAKKRKFEETDTAPKRPLTAFFRFMRDQQDSIRGDSQHKMTDFSKIAAAKWKTLPTSVKAKYDAEYELERSKYQSALSVFLSKKTPSGTITCTAISTVERDNVRESNPLKRKEGQNVINFFNKIVKLKKEGLQFAHPEFEYYYVLTYIPDLYWCHLAPLRTVGFFGSNKPSAEGKPVWMLVSEDEGKEIDISAQYCEVVRARAMKGGADADKEQWDIREAESVSVSSKKKTQRNMMSDSSHSFSENLIDMADHVNGQSDNKFTDGTKAVHSAVNISGLSTVLARRAAMKTQHLLH